MYIVVHTAIYCPQIFLIGDKFFLVAHKYNRVDCVLRLCAVRDVQRVNLSLRCDIVIRMNLLGGLIRQMMCGSGAQRLMLLLM